ncbi:MAG: SagB/ThcOx family dehydrogenase [Anaerolineae bacterium]|nr:SagB/ThcOx family dehydrogenase [Anaerolineae bacterium]
MQSPEENRHFLKTDTWEELLNIQTDQEKKIPHPPLQQPYPEGAPLIDLVPPADFTVGNLSVREAIAQRQSQRWFTDAPLSLEELSFLLWATQGIHEIWRGGVATRRTVPSAGARHPFETYLMIHNVTSLEPGLYRYLAVDHRLCRLSDLPSEEQAKVAFHGQMFAIKSAVTVIWTAVPYRTEWRYHAASAKLIAVDSGHVCQNMYLACAAIGAGTCAIGAYSQKALDVLLGVDGVDEFAVYVAPIGKV